MLILLFCLIKEDKRTVIHVSYLWGGSINTNVHESISTNVSQRHVYFRFGIWFRQLTLKLRAAMGTESACASWHIPCFNTISEPITGAIGVQIGRLHELLAILFSITGGMLL